MSRLCATVFLSGTRPVERPGASWNRTRYLVKLFALWRDQAVLCLTDGLGYGNGENGDFYTIPLSGGEPELLLRHSHHCVGNTVATDSRLGAGETWRVCGDTLYFLSTVDGTAGLRLWI